MTGLKKIYILPLLVLLLLMLALLVLYFHLREQEIQGEVSGPGIVIIVPFSGAVKELPVQAGMRVEAGATLFVMDTGRLAEELEAAIKKMVAHGAALPYDVRREAHEAAGLATDSRLLPDVAKQLKILQDKEADATTALQQESLRHSRLALSLSRQMQQAGSNQTERNRLLAEKRKSDENLDLFKEKVEQAGRNRAAFENEFSAQTRALRDNPQLFRELWQSYNQEAAQVKAMQNKLENTTVVAPFAAYIGSLELVKGKLAEQGQDAMRLDPSDERLLWVEAHLPRDRAKNLQPGAPCLILLPDNTRAKGVLANLKDSDNAVTAMLHFVPETVHNPALRPGLKVKVEF